MAVGLVTNVLRDGHPSLPDSAPGVTWLEDMGDGTAAEHAAYYAGNPPPEMVACEFADVGGGLWFTLGPTDVDLRDVELEEFLTMPGFSPDTQTWTPTLAQGASSNISKTVNMANYWRIGDMVFFEVKVTASAAGTAGSSITITLPVTGVVAAQVNTPVGTGAYLDTGTAQYPAIVEPASTTTLAMYRADVTVAGYIGASPNIAVASGDIFYAWGRYQAA